MTPEEISQKIASDLLAINAVKFNLRRPYRWSSGWKSPIYCDNRLSLSFPKVRTFIKEKLGEAVQANYPKCEVIAGVATAGIPQGALVADYLDLPFVYVRSMPKGHGLENLIEGKLGKRAKVVVIEDLISTGGSSIQASKALKAAGARVLGLVAIFSYGFEQASRNLSQAEVPFVTLSEYADLLFVAKQQKIVTDNDLLSLKSWRVDPENWG